MAMEAIQQDEEGANSSYIVEENITFYFTHEEHEYYNPHLHNVTFEKWVIYGLAMPSLAAMSLLFNAMIFVALLRSPVRSSLNLLLHCLASYDILVAVMSFWIFSLPALLGRMQWFHHYLTEIHPQLIPFLYPIWHMTITGSDYLNLAAACERCLATDGYFNSDKKSQHHNGCSITTTYLFMVKIFLLTVMFNIPAFFEMTTMDIDPNTEQALNHLEVFPTALRQHKIYTSMYRLMAEFLIFKATPWFAFFILWLRLSRRIWHYTMKRRVRITLTRAQFEEMKDAQIIIGIIALFYVTNILIFSNSFCHIMSFHIPELVLLLAHLSLVANSTFKFFIYLGLSKSFRKGLQSIYYTKL